MNNVGSPSFGNDQKLMGALTAEMAGKPHSVENGAGNSIPAAAMNTPEDSFDNSKSNHTVAKAVGGTGVLAAVLYAIAHKGRGPLPEGAGNLRTKFQSLSESYASKVDGAFGWIKKQGTAIKEKIFKPKAEDASKVEDAAKGAEKVAEGAEKAAK